MDRKTSVFANGLIWFGAAVSIAEIEAGFSIGGNWAALVAGHLFGGLMLFAAGLLGATSGKNAMETTAATFGVRGMHLLAALNIVQLVGWTAAMLAQGGAAVSALAKLAYTPACLTLAVLTGAWIYVAFGDRLHLAPVAMCALAVLAVALTVKLHGTETSGEIAGIGFWPAFEISAAMPLSWLPLVSDYTSTAERPKAATAASAAVYSLVSIWMYALGMMIARTGNASIAGAILKSGLGAIGLAVVVFSTVTTTFLDAYSSGESARSIFPNAPARSIGVAVCALGGVTAACGLMDHYIGFLCLISSVFAPMAAVLLTDRYLVKRSRVAWNVAAWLAGVVTYRFAAGSPVGPTLTAVATSAVLVIAQSPLNAAAKDSAEKPTR